MSSIREHSQNPWLLAADGSTNLIPLLRSRPELAGAQDSSGYSLLHALTSYNHLDLLREVVRDFHVDPNLRDEDGETALFVAETVPAAELLVGEIGVDVSARNHEGLTAEEKIRAEGDFVNVAEYLKGFKPGHGAATTTDSQVTSDPVDPTAQSSEHPGEMDALPPLPPGVRIDLETVDESSLVGEADSGFRQRIEELMTKENFAGAESQRELRELVTDAVRSVSAEEPPASKRTR